MTVYKNYRNSLALKIISLKCGLILKMQEEQEKLKSQLEDKKIENYVKVKKVNLFYLIMFFSLQYCK